MLIGNTEEFTAGGWLLRSSPSSEDTARGGSSASLGSVAGLFGIADACWASFGAMLTLPSTKVNAFANRKCQYQTKNEQSDKSIVTNMYLMFLVNLLDREYQRYCHQPNVRPGHCHPYPRNMVCLKEPNIKSDGPDLKFHRN